MRCIPLWILAVAGLTCLGHAAADPVGRPHDLPSGGHRAMAPSAVDCTGNSNRAERSWSVPHRRVHYALAGNDPPAAGQRRHDAGSTRRTVPKPGNIVTRDQWGSDPAPIDEGRRHTPRWITIHHAGVLWTNTVEPDQFVRNLQAWGKRRPELEQPPRDTFWPDLPYHYLIAPDGRIFEGRPVEYEPESNTDYLLAGNLGIELMGNFEQQRPSPAQLESLVRLTAWLMDQHEIGIERVRTHRDAAPGQTSCPGRDLYRYATSGELQAWIETVLRGEKLAIDPGPPLTDPPGPTQLITETRPPAEID